MLGDFAHLKADVSVLSTLKVGWAKTVRLGY